MANYVKSTNFASKDALAVGNPLKIVKGTEIDTEFNNIATAINTKSDINSPAFTGNPSAPTPTFGNNTTSLATTAFVQAAVAATLQAAYPVGSVYINASSATNPATLLGFGTWVEFGAGRVMVGQNASDALFDTLEETGGSKDAIAVSHTHTITDPGHTHTYSSNVESTDDVDYAGTGVPYLSNRATATTASRTTGISINSAGSDGTNANVQPYIVVKMWKRTA